MFFLFTHCAYIYALVSLRVVYLSFRLFLVRFLSLALFHSIYLSSFFSPLFCLIVGIVVVTIVVLVFVAVVVVIFAVCIYY